MARSSEGWTKAHIVMGISMAFGWLGFDRFYLGQTGWGVIKLLTLGGIGLWWLLDALYYTHKAGQSLR